jgi:hypothetical protein
MGFQHISRCFPLFTNIIDRWTTACREGWREDASWKSVETGGEITLSVSTLVRKPKATEVPTLWFGRPVFPVRKAQTGKGVSSK